MTAPSKTDKCQRGRDPVIREDGSIEIPLTQGQYALVDEASYGVVRDHRWCAQWNKCTNSYYARRSLLREHTVYLHREVTGAMPGSFVDHKNHCTLDCRLSNLRIVSRSENMRNVMLHIDNKSGYKGVFRNRRLEKWQARIRVGGKEYYLGLFVSAADAARSYDAAAVELFGEHAMTNSMMGVLDEG